MGITTSFDFPYYFGGGVTSEVPGVFPVAIDGHPYLLDLKSGQFKRSSLPLLRTQADQGNRPSESSLNPDDLWRRVIESWNAGTGQQFQDRDESAPSRFYSSEGVDPWTRWQLSLLPATLEKRSSANTNLRLIAAGTRLYIQDGNTSLHTSNITAGSPTFTTITGTPVAAATSLASDGANVYLAYGSSGLYLSSTTTSTAISWITGNCNLVRYLKGRLLVASDNMLYNVTTAVTTPGPTPLPATLLTHPNPSFDWVDMAEGPGMIYFAGFAGDKSLIYRTAVKADGSALDIPVVAGELPDGEIVRAIQGYLGFILIGSDLGIRFCVIDGNGNLTLGPLIQAGPCQAFEPQDRFVWFGWDEFDSVLSPGSTVSSLGRLDLSVFTQPLAPAYASDLGDGIHTGDITGIATVFHGTPVQELRVYAVNGDGFYAQTSNKRATGAVESGWITYGIFDKKFGMFLDIRCDPLEGEIAAEVANDNGIYITIGELTEQDASGVVLPVNQLDGRKFRFRLTLTRATDTTAGPVMVRETFRSYPAPRRIEIFEVPILLYDELNLPYGIQRHLNIQSELEFLISIVQERRIVTYQEPIETYSVLVEDYEFQPHHMNAAATMWNGTMLLRLKTITE